VQELSAGIVPPVRCTVEPPAVAVSVPPQVVLPLLETVTPLGSVSVNVAAVAAAESELLKVMVSVETAPAPIEAGLKVLLNVGATLDGAVTVKLATAGDALLPLELVNAPTGRESM
jgi:hypothetical protein